METRAPWGCDSEQVQYGVRQGGTGPASKAVEGEPKKLSMGVTLPTVPVRLVKRILLGEFVDMGELSQEAL